MMTWEELVAIHTALPEPEPVVMKLYYNEHGKPITYTTDNLQGNYIEVDAATFAERPMRVRVENGAIAHLPSAVYYHKLVPSDSGTLCHTQDVAVIVTQNGQHWKTNTYEN